MCFIIRCMGSCHLIILFMFLDMSASIYQTGLIFLLICNLQANHIVAKWQPGDVNGYCLPAFPVSYTPLNVKEWVFKFLSFHCSYSKAFASETQLHPTQRKVMMGWHFFSPSSILLQVAICPFSKTLPYFGKLGTLGQSRCNHPYLLGKKSFWCETSQQEGLIVALSKCANNILL